MRTKEQIMNDVRNCEAEIRYYTVLLIDEQMKLPELSAEVTSYERELNENEKIQQSRSKADLDNLDRRIAKGQKNVDNSRKQYEKILAELVDCFHDNNEGHALTEYID